jgi:hypothetical protein
LVSRGAPEQNAMVVGPHMTAEWWAARRGHARAAEVGGLQNVLRSQGAERVYVTDSHFSRAALEADRV